MSRDGFLVDIVSKRSWQRWMSPYMLPPRLALEDLHAPIKEALTLQHLKYILSVTIDCNDIIQTNM